MIISTNKRSQLQDFEKLVYSATDYLNSDAQNRTSYYETRGAQKLEDDVVRALNRLAKDTAFEGTIKKISGHKFPDIVANDYFGVEVKSSFNTNWVTLGGSVNESTRVDGIERIFVTFGKLVSPIEFRTRPYEDCLSEVVVTHYPRYKIDMNLEKGNTIFDKMNTTYDELRTSKNPVHKIVEYYKSNLKDGETLWWIDTDENEYSKQTENTKEKHQDSQVKEKLFAEKTSKIVIPKTEIKVNDTLNNLYARMANSMKVRLWRSISIEEKKSLVRAGFAFFPIILSESNIKYEQFSLWLAARFGIISTSLRDSFSAGGKETVLLNGKTYKIKQAQFKILQNRLEIMGLIYSADESFLQTSWNVPKIESDRLGQWIEIVSSYSDNPLKEIQLYQDIFYS